MSVRNKNGGDEENSEVSGNHNPDEHSGNQPVDQGRLDVSKETVIAPDGLILVFGDRLVWLVEYGCGW